MKSDKVDILECDNCGAESEVLYQSEIDSEEMYCRECKTAENYDIADDDWRR